MMMRNPMMMSKFARQQFTATIILIVAALFMFHATACGAGQRQAALKHAVVGVDAAAAAFVVWDAAYQDDIVERAPDYATGREQLDAYRLDRERVYEAFTVAYRAIAAAGADDDEPLAAALANVAALYRAIEGLQGTFPELAQEAAPDAAPAPAAP